MEIGFELMYEKACIVGDCQAQLSSSIGSRDRHIARFELFKNFRVGFNRLTSLQHFRRIIVCWLIDKVLHKNDVVLKCLSLE